MKSVRRPLSLLFLGCLLIGHRVGATAVTPVLSVGAPLSWTASTTETATGIQAATQAWLDDNPVTGSRDGAAPAPSATTLAPQMAMASPAIPLASGARLQAGYGQLPMRFEPNLGQSNTSVQFIARGPGYQLFLTPAEAVLVLRQGKPLPPPQTKTTARLDGPAAAASSPGTTPVTQTPPAVIRMRLEGVSHNASPLLEGLDPGPQQLFHR